MSNGFRRRFPGPDAHTSGTFAAGFGFLLAAAACGGNRPAAAEPPAPPADTTTSPPPEPTVSASPTDVSDNTPPAQATPPAEAQPEPSASELCQKMCDRLKERCSADAVEKCRGNCREWNSPPPGCETEVKTALECAIQAEDIQCVNIMPSSCTRKFKRIEACASGTKSDAPELSLDMPSGWQRFQSKEAGYSVPMPPGVEIKEANGEKVASASVGAVSYSVRVVPAPPPGKKDLLVAQGLLGDCIKKLQLKGLIERAERRSLEFKAGCASGRETSGVFVTIGQRLYVVSVTGPGGSLPNRDVFVYGFKAGL